MKELEELRLHIDRIDNEIIDLLARREGVIREIVQHKSTETEVRGADRVSQVIARVRELARRHGLFEDTAEAIYRTIIEEFTALQMREFQNRKRRLESFDVLCSD